MSVWKYDLVAKGKLEQIPDDAKLFYGSFEQFEDLLGRMKKKYGHLYGE